MNLATRIKGKLGREAFSLAGKIGSCSIEDTIVIAGSPRSGTTLLLEALHKIPGYKTINEPLLTPRIQKMKGFHSRSYIHSGTSSEMQFKFLEEVLKGQMDPSARWLFDAESTFGRILEHSMRKKLLVKFCRINRMLPWFADQFDVRSIIFIIRHPCAVVNSMLRYGQWNKLTSEYFHKFKQNPTSTIYISDLPQNVQEIFEPIQERVSTHAEALTFMWCLDHYLPLINSLTHPWILVSYEQLIKHNRQELKRITDSLNIDLNDQVVNVLDKPSSSVKEEVNKNTNAQLEKWKKQLTTRQIDSILSIVDSAGLSSIFTDHTEPNYEYLNNLQHPNLKW